MKIALNNCNRSTVTVFNDIELKTQRNTTARYFIQKYA